jgi:hypothetical protein
MDKKDKNSGAVAKRSEAKLSHSEALSEALSGTQNHLLDIKVLGDYPWKIKKNNQYNIIPSHCRRSLFIGKTLAGKTNLVANLLTRKEFLRDYFNLIFIFTPNADSDPKYKLIQKKNKSSKVFLEPTFNEQNIEKIIKFCKVKNKQLHEEGSEPLRSLVLVDDFADDHKIMNSRALASLFTRGRHQLISSWVLTQYYKAIPPIIRGNTEHFIIWQLPELEIEKIAEERAIGRVSKKIVRNMLLKLDDLPPYSFLHINLYLPTTKGRFNYNFKQNIIV